MKIIRRLFRKRPPTTPPAKREFAISGEINDEVANSCIAHLLYWKMENPSSPVTIEVNSIGGSVTATFAILDTMAFVGYPIHTMCKDLACGCAALILARGTRGCRTASPCARIVLTKTKIRSAPQSASAHDLERFATNIDTRIIDELCTVTGRNREEVMNDQAAERVFGAEEAVAYGLIDHSAKRLV